MYFSQNHNISVINIKNGREYQEFIFYVTLWINSNSKKTLWKQDWLCIKSLYLSIVQRIIAGIFSSAMITQSFSFFSKQRMLCIEPSLLHEFNILPCTEPSFCCKFNIPLQLFTKPSFSYKLQTQYISYQLTIGQSLYYLR